MFSLEDSAMTRYATLHARTEEGVRTITMNRPDKRNALNPVMMEDLMHALMAAGDDSSCGSANADHRGFSRRTDP